MKAKTKNVLTACVALALVACAVLGTIAYMTATSDKTNEFTVGKFDHPTTDPENPDKTLDPELDGYILEKKWDAATEHKLVPGNTLDKDPRIGIGKGSEDAYVYAFVKNGMASNTGDTDTVIRDGSVYFALNEGWSFVSVDGVDYKKLTVDGKDYYTGGLFKYNTKLSAGTADAWTGTVFDSVVCGKDMNTAAMAGSSDNNIVVSAYIHQATDGNGSDLATTAETAAKAWAAELVK